MGTYKGTGKKWKGLFRPCDGARGGGKGLHRWPHGGQGEKPPNAGALKLNKAGMDDCESGVRKEGFEQDLRARSLGNR